MGCWAEAGKYTGCVEWDVGCRRESTQDVQNGMLGGGGKVHRMCRMGYWVEVGKQTGCVEWDVGLRLKNTQDV